MTGGTGFVGRNLTQALVSNGYKVFILTRSPHTYHNTKQVTYLSYNVDFTQLPTIHAVINLAGESLFGYWTMEKKQRILNSRLETTTTLISLMKQMDPKPDVFLSASAVGYYGTSDEMIFTEKSKEPGEDFLADVVSKWEQVAQQAEAFNIRTVCTRFGVVLGDDGALPFMSLPVKLFAGGKIGSGNQYMSWVHIDDVVGLLMFCLNHHEVKGPINITAPTPKQNKQFMKTLAIVLKRPYWFSTPALLVRLATGEMSTIIVDGQYVLPGKAEKLGYEFKYPTLENALKSIFY